MDLEYELKTLLAKTDFSDLNYKTRRFLIFYQGDALTAAKDSGFDGTDATIRVRVSQMKKDQRVSDYLQQANKIIAEYKQHKTDAIMQNIDTRSIVRKLDRTKDDMDLSWCNQKQAHFLLLYSGSLKEAARAAGYSGKGTIIEQDTRLQKAVYNLMRDERMKNAVKLLDKTLEEQIIMSATRAKVLLTEFGDDPDLDNRQRQAAITTILKSHGALNEKLLVEQHTKHTERKEIVVKFKHLPPGVLGVNMGLADTIDGELTKVDEVSTKVGEPAMTLADLL